MGKARIPSKQTGITASNVLLQGVSCNSNVYIGSAVYMNASGVAQLALANDVATSNIIGICEHKATAGATLCDIRVLGVTKNIFSGLDVTKNYYLSDTVAGGIQTSPPTTSGHIMLKIGQPYSSTELLVLKNDLIVRA